MKPGCRTGDRTGAGDSSTEPILGAPPVHGTGGITGGITATTTANSTRPRPTRGSANRARHLDRWGDLTKHSAGPAEPSWEGGKVIGEVAWTSRGFVMVTPADS
jgi:hypothetical protein